MGSSGDPTRFWEPCRALPRKTQGCVQGRRANRNRRVRARSHAKGRRGGHWYALDLAHDPDEVRRVARNDHRQSSERICARVERPTFSTLVGSGIQRNPQSDRETGCAVSSGMHPSIFKGCATTSEAVALSASCQKSRRSSFLPGIPSQITLIVDGTRHRLSPGYSCDFRGGNQPGHVRCRRDFGGDVETRGRSSGCNFAKSKVQDTMS